MKSTIHLKVVDPNFLQTEFVRKQVWSMLLLFGFMT